MPVISVRDAQVFGNGFSPAVIPALDGGGDGGANGRPEAEPFPLR
jgi:hypothetical protein